MANTLRIKRRAAGGAAGAPTPLEAGELAVNFSDNKLYIGDGTTAVPIAGKGEFVDLGSTQTITGKKTFSGGIDMGDTQLENLLDPRSGATGLKDATNRGYVDSAISTAVAALGSVFEYVGNVSLLTDSSDPLNLDTLAKKEPGDYYRVDVAGTYTAAGQTLKAKVGDAFVRTATDWQRLDNVDAEVYGTTNEIAVTGDENTGYTVAIDPAFSGRLSTAETDITDLQTKTQNISSTETVAGTTKLTGSVNVDSSDYNYAVAGTQVTIGNGEVQVYKSSEDVAVKLSTEGIYRDWTFPAAAPDLKLETNSGSVLVKTQNGEITLDASAVNVSANLSGSGTSTLDGFSIDGGVF